jgi:hypothetical protein
MARVTTATCPTCGRGRGERHKAVGKAPSIKTMERWLRDCGAEATDGCWVEPDGTCEHGHSSWLLRLGLI